MTTNKPKERPILFSAEMVRAILDGRKTQTRRTVKLNQAGRVQRGKQQWHIDDPNAALACPYGQPGDRLWVRETWAPGATQTMYRAGCSPDYLPPDGKWRPSIHIPRWASRITLEITGVRVERLQDISEDDARDEGIEDGGCLNCGEREPCECSSPVPDARDSFAHLWQSINGPDSWDVNPWVWVVEFRRAKQ